MIISIKEKNKHNAELLKLIPKWEEDLNPYLHYLGLSHICYIVPIEEDNDFVYFDFPYNEKADELNEELDKNQQLTEVNRQIFNKYYEAQKMTLNGYIYYDYAYCTENNCFHLFDMKTNMQEDNFITEYLPLLDSSIFLTEHYTGKVYTKNSVKKSKYDCEKKIISIGKRIHNEDENTKNSSLICSFEIKKKLPEDLEIVVENIYNKIFTYIEQYFYSPVVHYHRIIIRATNEQKKFITAHKHTIKNFQFRGKLNSLLTYLPSNDERAKEIYENLENTLKIRDIATQSLYNISQISSPHSDIFKNYECDTYLRILLSIHKSATIAYRELEFFEFQEDELINHPLNIIPEVDLVSVFNLLLNLYSNVRKYADDKKFYIVVNSSSNKSLTITFKNQKPISEDHVCFLNTGRGLENIDKNKGLYIIKSSEKHLNYVNLYAQVLNKHATIITLKIQHNENTDY